MTDTVVSVRVDKQLHNQMKLHDEVNWSAVLRKSIEQKIDEVEQIDIVRAKHATEMLKQMRDKRVFDKGKTTGELIREWRDKRR